MTIEEKSKEYAKGKALDALTAAIEHAYMEGYKAGLNEGAANSNNNGVVSIDGIDYVDLKLPSGTLWSPGYLKEKDKKNLYLTYFEASKLNIPAEIQFEELEKYCKKEIIANNGVVCGVRYSSFENNAHIDLNYCNVNRDYGMSELHSFGFWLKNTLLEDVGKAIYANVEGKKFEYADFGLPVMVVKYKQGAV